MIDTVPSFESNEPVLQTFRHVVKLTSHRELCAKVTYIWTNGTWTQARGPGGLDKWTSEQQPLADMVKLVAGRWPIEKEILSCEFDSIIALLHERPLRLMRRVQRGASMESSSDRHT